MAKFAGQQFVGSSLTAAVVAGVVSYVNTGSPVATGGIKIDNTAVNNRGANPFQFHDYVVSRNPGGLYPGTPRTYLDGFGGIMSMSHLTLSAVPAGDFSAGTGLLQGPFETSTSTAALSGVYKGMGAIRPDVEGPGLQVSALNSSDGYLFLGGLHNFAYIAIDHDGSIWWEPSGLAPPTTGGAANKPATWMDTKLNSPAAQVVRFSGSGSLGGCLELGEFNGTTDATAGASNFARLYARDNGAGKTQIVARFPTGAVQVLATEP